MNFGPVIPELTELICERLLWHSQKTGVFSRLSTDIYWTDFRNLFTVWKCFGWRWSICTYFPICQGTLPWQPNNLEWNNKVMKTDC